MHNKAIGILGGTFDPIHFGHLRLAEEMLELASLSQIRFIPTGIPPHRDEPQVSAQHRNAMVRLAITDQPAFVLDEREARRTTPCYTVDTLRELRDELGAAQPLCLLMGGDAFLQLHTWHEWEQLFELAHIVVGYRPGFTLEERNLLLRDGISTFTVDPDGTLRIERVITTYQTNTFGMDDVSLLKLNTKWTVDYMRFAFRSDVLTNFPRHKLAGDDVLERIQPGQAIATPKLIRNVNIGTAIKLEKVGLLEDLDQFIKDLIVVRSDADANRVNAILPPNIINQFDVFAAAVQYIL